MKSHLNPADLVSDIRAAPVLQIKVVGASVVGEETLLRDLAAG